MSMETQQKTKPSQIVRLDKAFKLAELWVNNMSKTVEDQTEAEPEGRPARLGLGAKVVRQSKISGSSNDPIERKLHAKLEAGKRKLAKSIEESLKNDDDDDSSEEPESRTRAFVKKRTGTPISSLQVHKRKK
ncbi:uncharacterized protein [Euphorbia lathyris]|uniref:uncharacterized protein n=1 Tax=Euphorbia lathyris TaxID=212925 RepID=UPI003313287A